jgi:hypothetical protein
MCLSAARSKDLPADGRNPPSVRTSEAELTANSLLQFENCFLRVGFQVLKTTQPGLRYLYSCTYTDMGCPLIEVRSF